MSKRKREKPTIKEITQAIIQIQTTQSSIIDWMKKLQDLGAGEILLTSMDRDGTKKGFDLELLSRASNELNIPVIASGGAGNLNHFWMV